jgi:hypothetical protein
LDPNHDAVIRIGGEAPGRRAHSKPRRAGHVQYRVAATSDRHLQSVIGALAAAENLLLAGMPLRGRAKYQALEAGRLNLFDPLFDEAEASHVAPQLGQVFGGRTAPSGVRSVSRCWDALRNIGLKLRMPRRANAAFIVLTMRVRSPTRFSRSRPGRFASYSVSVGIAAILQ